MADPLRRLESAAAAVDRADEKRARAIARRDAEIVAALAAGATWVQVQDATGLSPRGVQLAVKRHRETNS